MGTENGQEATGGAAPGIGEAARKVKTDFESLGTAINQSGHGLVRSLEQAIADRPLASVAIAFGVGYVLGGGLFSRATARLLGIGLRIGGLALARQLFEQGA